MKELRFLFLILGLPIQSWAQGYIPSLGKTSTRWYSAREAIDRVDNITISTRKDTIIDEKEYKELFIEGISERINFYIREDTILGKVWMYDPSNQKEVLTMDLSLEKGDTFKIYNSIYDNDSVAVVDSVYYIEGKKQVVFDYQLRINLNYEKLTFIEGLGPNNGFLFQIESLSDNLPYTQLLLCVFKNEEIYYKNQYIATESCVYAGGDVGIKNRVSSYDIRVFPNPASDILNIIIPESSSGILEIYSMNGILMNRQCFSDSEKCISISNLNSGVYQLFFKSQTNEIAIGKFIKL
jgi:hypothetical protein